MKCSLREVFLLVALVAVGCGWWVDRSQFWKMVETSADSEMFQMDRILNLEDAIRAKGFSITWSEDGLLPTLVPADNPPDYSPGMIYGR